MFLRHASALLVAGSLLATTTAAQPLAEGEIVIRSRTATVQQQAGVAEYVGNAELVQGQRQLKAERLLLYLRDNQPYRVEATGSPVTLKEGSALSASANRLVYDMDAGRIWLYENARVEHEGRLFEGAELEYRVDTQQVNARAANEQDRVKLVIPAEPDAQENTQ